MRRVMADMHCRQIAIGDGMTETSPISFQSALDDPVDRRMSTVGRVEPRVECHVVDVQGRTLPVGQTAKLVTRGYPVVQGYWNDPDRSAEAVRGGWMFTGDLATIDAQGLRDWCRGQIAHCKVPRHVRFAADMPMTATGKPQRFLMRDAMIADMGRAGYPATCASRDNPDRNRAPVAVTTATSSSRMPNRPGR